MSSDRIRREDEELLERSLNLGELLGQSDPSTTTPVGACKRIVLVTAGYFPDSRGGAERQAKILAEALGRRGIDVTLAVPTTWAEAPPVEPTPFGRIERFKVKAYPNAGGRYILDFLRWTRWFRAHIAPKLDGN